MQYLEFNEQKSFIQWCRLAARTYPELALLYCNHNTQKLSGSQAGRWAAAGGKSGVPDLFLPVARHNFHGFFLEFKSPSLKPKTSRGKGGLRDEQLEFFPLLEAEGYKVIVCYDWLEAKKEIEDYLKG